MNRPFPPLASWFGQKGQKRRKWDNSGLYRPENHFRAHDSGARIDFGRLQYPPRRGPRASAAPRHPRTATREATRVYGPVHRDHGIAAANRRVPRGPHPLPLVNAAVVLRRVSASHRADRRMGGRHVAFPPLTPRQGRTCSRRALDSPVAATNGEAPRGGSTYPPRLARLELCAFALGSSSACLGIRAHASGSVSTTSGSMPPPRDSCPLPRDSRQRHEIRSL